MRSFWKSMLKQFALMLVVALSLSLNSSASEKDAHYDPTHGHAGASNESLIDLKSDKSLFTAVVFGLLCVALYAMGWKPISEGLQKRELSIATQIADAKKASEDALAKLKEYEAKLATAQTQAQDLLTQARKDAESAGQRILQTAQDEAARQKDRAVADIETAKQAALSDIATKSTDLAFSLARRVIGRELNSTDHQFLTSQSLNQMPNRN